MPLWLRLLIFYLFAGLAISLYREQRAAGKSAGAALAGILWAAVAAPVTAVIALFQSAKAAATVLALATCCTLASACLAACPGPCPGGQCPATSAPQRGQSGQLFSTIPPRKQSSKLAPGELMAVLESIAAPIPAKPRHAGWRRSQRK
jgi:hypothetical protein